MDITAAMGRFFNEKGEITLAPQLTLAGLSELMYQGDLASGGGERVALKAWDFSASKEGTLKSITRTEVNQRIKAVAARLQQVAKIGDRVAILAGNSPEYLYGFMGALYAGLVPVPLYDPQEPGHAEHLNAVLADCGPTVVLTTSASAPAVRAYFKERPGRQRPRIIALDALPDTLAASWVNPMATPEGQMLMASSQTMPIDQLAFLQYTSGSTRTPAGVVLTNRSILTNVLQIFAAAKLQTPLRFVSWLPLHHDMGIILAAFCLILGLELQMMTPRDFIQQPRRWTRQLHRCDENFVYTVIPNFAMELAVRYGLPEEGEELDLSGLAGVIIGSEPVTEKAVTNFIDTFKQYGLPDSVVRPSYGLAEASLLLTTPQTEERPLVSHFDREKLAEGEAVMIDAGDEKAVAFTSNGQVVRPQFLTIVDPETRQEIEDGKVGEIWAQGENMAVGYLDRPEDTQETFHNTLAGRLENNSRVEGSEDSPWMATGDLGTIINNQIYITGRLKDLIVIAGRNHYPQDIEYTVEKASDHIRPACVAAFSIDGDDVEKLIILAERDLDRQASDDAEAIEKIRSAVSASHGVVPADVRILAPDEIARSSSAKIARRVCRKHYLADLEG